MPINKPNISNRSLVMFLLAGLLSIMSILFILSRVDGEAVLLSLQKVEPSYVVISTCITVAMLLVSSLRWRILLSYRLPYVSAVSATFLGFLANAVLPFRMGELVRARIIKRNGIAMSEALPSILLGQVMDVLVLVIFGVFLMLVGTLATELTNTILLVGIIAILALLGLYLFTQVSMPFHDNIHRFIHVRFGNNILQLISRIVANIRAGLSALENPLQFFYAIVLSLGFWIALSFANWLLLVGLIDSPSILIGIILAFSSGLGRMIPALPGDIGTLDVVVLISIILLGVPEDIAITVTVLIRVRYIMTAITSGLLGLAVEGLTQFSRIRV